MMYPVKNPAIDCLPLNADLAPNLTKNQVQYFTFEELWRMIWHLPKHVKTGIDRQIEALL